MRRSYGKSKTKTLNGRITDSFHSSLKDTATYTNISQADLLEDAWDNYVNDKSNFVICPKCKAPYFPISMITVDGTMQCECRKCGNEFLHTEGN